MVRIGMLGLCGCSEDCAADRLLDTLEFIADKDQNWEALVAQLYDSDSAAAYIAVQYLDDRQLIEHGTSIRCSWLTANGEETLIAAGRTVPADAPKEPKKGIIASMIEAGRKYRAMGPDMKDAMTSAIFEVDPDAQKPMVFGTVGEEPKDADYYRKIWNGGYDQVGTASSQVQQDTLVKLYQDFTMKPPINYLKEDAEAFLRDKQPNGSTPDIHVEDEYLMAMRSLTHEARKEVLEFARRTYPLQFMKPNDQK